MYRKYAGILLIMLLPVAAVICTAEESFLHKMGKYNEAIVETGSSTIRKDYDYDSIAGNQPHLTVQSVERTGILLNEEDKMILYKIVEAEAGGEDRTGKILVANVVLNRLEDDSFPDTVAGVVFQKDDGVTQFSPVANGKYASAVPDEETIEAVEAALMGEDYSDGALYFMARKYADSENVKWFDTHLEPVLVYGGHEFYK